MYEVPKNVTCPPQFSTKPSEPPVLLGVESILSIEDEKRCHKLSNLQKLGIQKIMFNISNELMSAIYSMEDKDSMLKVKYLQGELSILKYLLELSESVEPG